MAIKSNHALAVTAAATLLAGCSTVSSEHIGEGEPLAESRAASGLPFCDTVADPNQERCEKHRPPPAKRARIGSAGFAYFLPRQLARVTATRTGGPLDDAVKALVKAQTAVEAAETEIKTIKMAIRATEDVLIKPKLPDDAKAILETRVAEQRAALAEAEATLTKKKTAYDQAKADLETARKNDSAAREQAAAAAQSGTTGASTASGEKPKSATGPGAYKVALKIELLPPSADPDQAYLLSPHHNPFRDDEHKLIVSPAGLLTSTDIVATDRTADILVEVATFAGAIIGGPLPSFRGGRSAPPKKCVDSPDEYTGIVDFADAQSIAQLNYDLQCLGVRAKAEGRVWPGDRRPVPDSRKTEPGIEGIVYRTPVQVQVRIEKCVKKSGACTPSDADWFPTEVVALALPQAGPISFVRQDAGFMTKTKYKLAFSDGILTSYDANRPSELLEAARSPMRLVNAVFDGLSKVISLRTGQNNAMAQLVAAQAALQAAGYTGQGTVSAAQAAAIQQYYAAQAANFTGQGTVDAAQAAALAQNYALQAAPFTGQGTVSAAQAAALQQFYAAEAAAFTGQGTVSAAQAAALQQYYAAQAAAFTGQATLSTQQLAMLQAQSGLAMGQNNLAGQLAASNFAATVAQLRYQDRIATLNRCIAEKPADQSIESCLAGF